MCGRMVCLSSREQHPNYSTEGQSHCPSSNVHRNTVQTKIIEINLMFKPEVADAILSGKQFSHYDRPRIAQLCEKSGLYMRALEHYSDLTDIRRVMANTHAIPPEALKEFFGTRLSAEWAAECLGDLVQVCLQLQTVPVCLDSHLASSNVASRRELSYDENTCKGVNSMTDTARKYVQLLSRKRSAQERCQMVSNVLRF